MFQIFCCCNFLFFFVIAPFLPTAPIAPYAAHEEWSLWISSPVPTPSFLLFFCYVPRFFERGFPRRLSEFGSVWVKNCCCFGPAKPFETLYMILVCTNKLDLTCLQLHHSYEACVCFNQSDCLSTLSVSLSRHVPMICYYLFPSLLTKKVTWHLPSGFNRHVSWRTRKMAFTVIEFQGP